MAIAILGIDLGKNSCSLVGQDATGRVVLRRRMRRETVMTFGATLPACIIAMDRRAVPPTINLDAIDPDCNLCHVPNHAREHGVQTALSNSFGFGGSNTTLVLRKAA